MVLWPVNSASSPASTPIPAWTAIEARQLAHSPEYWLVTQPDHAELAGKLAAAIDAHWMPRLSPETVQAIAIHDAGWEAFDRKITLKNGRPASFLAFAPADYLAAWSVSIERAASLSPLGGLLVSRHFRRILQPRLHSPDTADADRVLMQRFLFQESEREQSAAPSIESSSIEALVDVLQFCDLLSLYLCCGATEPVNFPQAFSGRNLRLWRKTDGFALEPTPFSGAVTFMIPAQRWPRGMRDTFTVHISR